MSGQDDDRVVIGKLNEIRTRRPPWQLLMVGNTDGLIAFSAETNNALMRIFDLLPHLGGVNLAGVGAHLAKQAPDFDARNYGFARLSDLVAASGLVDMESTGDRPKIIMVKLKAAPAPK